MTHQTDFEFLREEFAERLVSEFEVPQELADKVAATPMRTDGGPEVMRMRIEWMAHCEKVARENAARRQS